MNIRNRLIFAVFLAFGLILGAPAKASEPPVFSQAELDSMLAPIALYPDSVLSHVLIAATYPLEVVQAARWSREHPGLRGEAAVEAVDHMPWDPSVQALVAFPELLERMDADLDWTQRLGDAFLIQEEEVLASIQYLRDEAYASGKLRSNEYVRVVRETEYIYVEPRRTQVIYVPYYDPRVVYSSWRWRHHRPYYWSRPSGLNVSVGFHWGSGYSIRPSFYFSSFNWAHRQVVSVHHHHHVHLHDWKKPKKHFRSGHAVAQYKGARHWKHNPTHRRGVEYRQGVDRTRFVDNRVDTLQGRGDRTGATASPQSRDGRRELAVERRSGLRSISEARETARAQSRPSPRSERGDSRPRTDSTQERSSSRSALTGRADSVARESGRRSSVERSSSPGRSALGSRDTDSSRTQRLNQAAPRVDELRGRLSSDRGNAARKAASSPSRERTSPSGTGRSPARLQRRPESDDRSSSRARAAVPSRSSSRSVESRRDALNRRQSSSSRSSSSRTPSRSVERSRSSSRAERSQSTPSSSRSRVQSSRDSNRSNRSERSRRGSSPDRSGARQRSTSRGDDDRR